MGHKEARKSTKKTSGSRGSFSAFWSFGGASFPGGLCEEYGVLDPGDHRVEVVFAFQVAEQKRTGAALDLGVAIHHAEISADERREIDFVDDEKIAVTNRGAAFAGDFVPFGDVDHVNERVDEFGGKRGCEVVAAAFDEQEL